MKITSRERNAIIQSLAAGVVPAIGLHHIQVGRRDEVEAIIKDLSLVEQGSATIRFIVGRFGSGKTFFLNLVRNVALKQKFVVVQADITTERRLHGSGGQARSLFSELMKNLSTQSRPEGGALTNLVERWIGDIDHSVRGNGGTEEDVKTHLTNALRPLQDLVSGFDFATVLAKYYEGYLGQNDELTASALRWLRAEYSTKTEARQALGVRNIIDDATLYDYLKLLAAFVRIAGYVGLLVNIDELVVLSHRLANTAARNSNYEAILRIINDCLQGRTQGLAFLFAGTDECLEDQRRGLYSYEALATRLAPNRFVTESRQDYSSPVVKLQNLSPEDCYVLLTNIRHVHANGDPQKYLIPDEGIVAYLKNCNERMGAAYFQTPRDTVKDFVSLLNMLEQDRSLKWSDLLSGNGHPTAKANPDTRPSPPASDDLTEFKL
ncbi:MAG: ATP-binding protein [Thermoguttaceae bacterium]